MVNGLGLEGLDSPTQFRYDFSRKIVSMLFLLTVQINLSIYLYF